MGKDCEVIMALKGNPFENLLSGKGPTIKRQPKEFEPLNPWDDPKPKEKQKSPIINPLINNEKRSDNNTLGKENKKSPLISETKEELDESQSTKFKSTENTSTNPKLTNSKRSERQLTESQSTSSLKKHPARNKRPTPKLTRKQLTKTKLTESQSTTLLEPYSKNQGRWMLPEHDLLDLLAVTDRIQKLTGNQWPVFLFMSLMAYEYDKKKGKRGTGIRRFAGSFLSIGLGLSPSTCNDAINELIAKGYVELLEKNNYGGNLYRVKPTLLYRPDPNQVDRKSVNVMSADLDSVRMLSESQSGC